MDIQEILFQIRQASEIEINEIAKAVTARYAVLYPEWDVTYIALHRDPDRRREDLKQIFALPEI